MKTLIFWALFCLVPVSAIAQPTYEEAAPTNDSSGDYNYREKTKDWMIAKAKTGTISSQLTFLTADRAPEGGFLGKRLKFTDVVLMRLGAGYAFGKRVQVSAIGTILPKQPSFSDESVFQNGQLAVKIGIIDHLAANVKVSGGSTLSGDGGWGSTSVGLDGRVSIDRWVMFELGLAGNGTAITVDNFTAGFTEIAPSVKIVAKAPKAAMWLGTTFAYPLSNHSSTDTKLEPSSRVNVQVGGVASFIDNWDLFAVYAFNDRGDIVENPSTTLPILDGGFDQESITFGVVYRFGENRD